MKNSKLYRFLFFRFKRLFKKRTYGYDTIISYGGFIVSIAVLTAALSLLSGYQKALMDGILGVNGHIYLYSSYRRTLNNPEMKVALDFLELQPEVEAFSPVITTNAMVSREEHQPMTPEQDKKKGGKVKGVIVKSQNWDKKRLPTQYKELITKGTGELVNTKDAVLGEKLAQYLNVEIGDEVRIISPSNMRYTIFGLKTGELPVKVVGLYRSGMYDTDSKIVFLNEKAIWNLLGTSEGDEEYSFVEIRVGDDYLNNVNSLASKWSEQLWNRFLLDTWIDYNGNLFTMLVIQRWVIFIILSFIIIIASFGIASNTTKTLIEKRKEIGILGALGAGEVLIKAYYMGETLFLGLLSVVFGMVIGIVGAWLLTKQTVLMLKGDVYFIESFGIVINPVTMTLILVVSLSIALISSYCGMNRISKFTIIDNVTSRQN